MSSLSYPGRLWACRRRRPLSDCASTQSLFSICLSMSSSLLSSHFIVFLHASLHPSLFSPVSFPSDGLHPTPSCTPFPSLPPSLQLIAASADYFIQCGPLRASSPGFGRALISHVNIPFIGLNITQHLPPSRRPPGSPCPVRTADY